MDARFTVIGPTAAVPGKPYAVYDHDRGHVAIAADPDADRDGDVGPLAYFATRRAARAWIRTHIQGPKE